MTTGDLLLYSYLVTLCLWFALSAANQFYNVSLWLSRFDPLSILPRWTFFAPNPGIDDQFVVFRTADGGLDLSKQEAHHRQREAISSWRELSHPALHGRMIYLLWRPSRRATKSITDLTRFLRQPAVSPEVSRLLSRLSFEYLLFCEMIDGLTEPGKQYQWAIVRAHGFEGRRSLKFEFLSDFHRKCGPP